MLPAWTALTFRINRLCVGVTALPSRQQSVGGLVLLARPGCDRVRSQWCPRRLPSRHIGDSVARRPADWSAGRRLSPRSFSAKRLRLIGEHVLQSPRTRSPKRRRRPRQGMVREPRPRHRSRPDGHARQLPSVEAGDSSSRERPPSLDAPVRPRLRRRHRLRNPPQPDHPATAGRLKCGPKPEPPVSRTPAPAVHDAEPSGE